MKRISRFFSTSSSSSSSTPIAYLNGKYLPLNQCSISVEDRGFLFADGLYEVTKAYTGKLFTENLHLARLFRGLKELRIGKDTLDRENLIQEVRQVSAKLLEKNNLKNIDSTIYVQITRGSATRAHAFPTSTVRPNLFLVAKPFINPPNEWFEQGVAGLLTPDQRWLRCDIKSISLLPNIMANQLAKENGAYEALLTRPRPIASCSDNVALVEASHSNVFAVKKDVLITHPSNDNILSGITRHVILDKAKEIGIKAVEDEILLSDIKSGAITEVFTTATTTEAMPIVKLYTRDGKTEDMKTLYIGNGKPGYITQHIRSTWNKWVNEEI
jgi:D-alanine transaminase